MKGLQEKGDGGIFLVIKHHCICQESKTAREGFKGIEVTNPKTGDVFTKWIKPYKAVEAMVKRIDWYDTEQRYDTRYMGWKLHLDAAGVACVLDIPFESRVCTRFMKVAENIDWSKPVEFAAWHDRKNDSTAFNVRQNGITVPQRYSKDEPGECPAPVQKFNGKWNYDGVTEFLYDRMKNYVLPQVEAANAANGHGYTRDGDDDPVIASAARDAEFMDDDIPF